MLLGCFERINFAVDILFVKLIIDSKMKNNKLILGIIAGLSVALIAILIAFIVQSTKQSKQIEQLEVEKERMELEHEYADLAEMSAKYDPEKLKDGINIVDGEEIFYISNPALGLWTRD